VQGDIQRFGVLSRQTFWPDDQLTRERQLPRRLAMLMLGLRIGQFVGLLFLIGLGALFALFVAAAYQGEALKMAPDIVAAERADFNRLNETKQYLLKWDRILTPRSQAWSTMDFVLNLFPEGSDVVCDKADYTLKQSETRPQAGQPSSGAFTRKWVIDGACNDRGRVILARLQETSTLTKIFASTAERFDDSSFAISGERSAKAIVREEANPQYGAEGQKGGLPYEFRLVVTQAFPANDELALPTLPKPKKTAMQP
jgi:hypothetical protein